MQGSRFPDPRTANKHGIVCFGLRLDVPTLVDAYAHGIFPWPVGPRIPVPWCSPAMRGVLDFAQVHVSRSLSRFLRKTPWRTFIDRDFPAVVAACAKQPRPGQRGTWITPAMVAAYVELHRAGHAHCLSCYAGEHLVGGIYGVFVGGVFSAESMFHAADNASKLCLLALIGHLQSLGLAWMDIQTLTDATAPFGAIEIPRDEFLLRLAAARARRIEWRVPPASGSST